MLNIIKQEILDCGGIKNYLYTQQYKTLLRFLTCGSVDDGKSTLIGRLLHDTNHIYEDQLLSLYSENNSFSFRKNKIDLALLVDGLQLERMQGITIDVAYRYFFTKKRKFIILDAPGHEEYTKNMITGASNSNLAILLVDASKGIRKQTRRHWFISMLMGIRYIILVVNKMDLVNYDYKIFQNICEKYLEFNDTLSLNFDTKFVPISALHGDNVVFSSKNMPWYKGPILFDILDNIVIDPVVDIANQQLRFPIQYVIRDQFNIRGYAGTVASGTVFVGKNIKVFPSNITSCVKSIFNFHQNKTDAFPGEAITLTLSDDIDIGRGDILIDSTETVDLAQRALVDVIWMKKEDLQKDQFFDVKITTKFYRVKIKNIKYQIDIHTFRHKESNIIPYNGIGLAELLFEEPVILDTYSFYPNTGSMIFVDLLTNDTVGAGMIRKSIVCDYHKNEKYSEFEIALHSLIKFHFPHWNIPDLS